MTPPPLFEADAARIESGLAALAAGGPASDARLAEIIEALQRFVLALYPREAYATLVEQLCELAVANDPALADLGQHLIFAGVVEPLGDAFDARAARLYDEIFADVIDRCRRVPAGQNVDERLRRTGNSDRTALLDRRATLNRRPAPAPGAIQAVLVLSRVTIGADVAVTSVVLRDMAERFPDAVIYLVGSTASELFADGGRVHAIPIHYERRGGLIGRLESWGGLIDACGNATSQIEPDACLIVDPDSRLTQLGLLPIDTLARHLAFFDSRSYGEEHDDSVSELTARWLVDVFGPRTGAPAAPYVTVMPADAEWARGVIAMLRGSGPGRIVGMNLGVGGNPRKRLEGTFELDLVGDLLAEGDTVLLDYGSPEEVDRIERIVATLRGMGVQTCAVEADRRAVEPAAAPALAQPPRLITYRGGLGPFAALLAGTDVYVGYDSAFQHIASAVGIPVVDLFVDPPNPTFAQRWRPSSDSRTRAVEIASTSPVRDVRAAVLDAYRSLTRTRVHDQL